MCGDMRRVALYIRRPEPNAATPRATIRRTDWSEKQLLFRDHMPLTRTSRPTILVLLGGVLCACASAPGGHPPAAKSTAVIAAPTTGTPVGSVAASQVPIAVAAPSTTSSTAAVASTIATSATAGVSATAKSADAKAPGADSKIICRTETPTGSRVGRRVCTTPAQREARDAAVRDQRDQMSRPSPNCGKVGPGGCTSLPGG